MATLIVIFALGWRFGLHPVLAFWAIYVLTRPLGASIGDFLSQPSDLGGLGLGATVTSAVFLIGILGIVIYLWVSRADVIEAGPDGATGVIDSRERGGLWQTVVVLVLVLVAAGTGYTMRKAALAEPAPASAVAAPTGAAPGGAQVPAAPGAAAGAPLGDLSQFRTITRDTLDKLNAGDQAAATTRVDDLETSWDNAQARLKARDDTAWTAVDGKIDTVLRELRSTSPTDVAAERAALTDLLGALG